MDRFTLSENVERDDENAPHLSGTVLLDRVPYDAGAWIAKTRNGDPYVSLSLRPAGDRNGQKISVQIWAKRNRTAETDPHFRSNTPILDVKYSLGATLTRDPITKLFALLLEIEPMGAGELSPHASRRHDELSETLANFWPAVETSHEGSTQEPEKEPRVMPRAGPAVGDVFAKINKPAPTINEAGDPDDIPF